MKTLYIIRGLPGSGKSTLAEKLVRHSSAVTHYVAAHYEADMFFIDPRSGEYRYRGELIPKAHAWCQSATRQALQQSINTVIVANVFATQGHVQAYLDMAKEFGYKVQVILCQGQFGSIHNVPAESIQRMKEKFEYEIAL